MTGFPTGDLLKRVVRSARSIYIQKGTREPRWAVVKHCLNLTEKHCSATVQMRGRIALVGRLYDRPS